MHNPTDLKARVRQMLVDNLMLQVQPDEITDELPLFGEGLGLDSVDALQIVVALDKNFGLKIKDAEMARGVLKNVNSIAAAIQAKAAGPQK
jgi:acyl carrier protein